jgi:hypothetical protein
MMEGSQAIEGVTLDPELERRRADEALAEVRPWRRRMVGRDPLEANRVAAALTAAIVGVPIAVLAMGALLGGSVAVNVSLRRRRLAAAA